jgi:2-desacetyl-2-hydroxyethyl bacteriochlorophyllide A dehydrogenase
MKAAVFQGVGKMEVKEIPTPVPGEGEILVKVQACGICGTDVHIFEGAEGAATVTPPVVVGHEFSGVVEKVGPHVRGIKEGDRVSVDPNDLCGCCYFCKSGLGHYCEHMIGYGTSNNGGFAQYCVVPYKQVYKLADHVSFEEGAMGEPIACCLHGIDMCEIKAGSTVMIVGGGTIGLIMVQLAKLSGAPKVVLLEPVQEKRELGLKVGADLALDPIYEDVEARLKEEGLDRIEVVIECVGLKRTMLDAIKYAGKKSLVMLFGLGHPNDEIPIKPFEVFKKELTIKASFINPYTQARAVELINSGRIDVKSLITQIIPLEELGEALANPEKRRGCKTIVNPWA